MEFPGRLRYLQQLMDKRRLVETIQAHLVEELATLVQAAKAAHEAATHEESRAEDAHDTRSVEASYLAGAQAQRAAELQSLLLMWKHLPIRNYGPKDVACPAALVELEFGHGGKKTRAFYFIAPQGGGLVTRVDGAAVQVITPNSPMGEALMGKKEGETIEVEMRGGIRSYLVISVR
jgi:transcription elongation GreA/GreB family factor